MFSKPIAAYQQIDREADIRGSDPHRLILLLFRGAIAALEKSKLSIAANDIPGKSQLITQAVAIIQDGLRASLDLQQGGELAQNLHALYGYMVTRLISANIKNDIAAIDEVLKLLGEIGGAWEEIAPPNGAPGAGVR
ncbi:MAG: flagellar export chaperone FliS [Propionivibrio sp.]